MALIVGNATVATGMSPVVEGALYADEIFIDELTYTSKYDIGNAGQIQVERYLPSSVSPRTPGSNFVDEQYQNAVININCNNSFQKSTKVPAFYRATMPTDVLASKTWDTTEAVRSGRQKSGLGALIQGHGVESVYSTSSVSKETIKAEIVADRGELRKKHSHPDVVLCSVNAYSTILEAAGKDFTPGINDEVVRSGRIGYWLGMLFVESSYLGADGVDLELIDSEGVLHTVSNDVEYIMYDHRAFSIIDKLTMLRIIDSEMFAGSKVQEELDVGFSVTNPDCVLIRHHAEYNVSLNFSSIPDSGTLVVNGMNFPGDYVTLSYPVGTSLTVEFIPSAAYNFRAYVVRDGNSTRTITDNPMQFVVNKPASGGFFNIFASAIEKPTHPITVTTDGNGTASANPASAYDGQTVTLTATPSAGYEFDSWTVLSGGVTIDENNQFVMGNEEVSIRANFRQAG